MARLPDLIEFARAHGLKIGTIADLIHHRSRNESLVERRRHAHDRNGARRVPAASSISDKTGGDCTSRWCTASWTPDRRSAGARARAAVGASTCSTSRARAIRGHCDQALAAISRAESGVIVLLHRPESAADLVERALPGRDRDDAEDGPAHLRHRRADPARLSVAKMRLLAKPAPNAEHGRLRSRGHRLSAAGRSGKVQACA